MKRIGKLEFLLFLSLAATRAGDAFAACGGTVRTWQADGNSTLWTDTNNWLVHGVGSPPDTATEDAYIRADSFAPAYPASSYTIGCLEVASGTLTLSPSGNRTLTIAGDYFRNLNSGSITFGANFTVAMAGTSPQTFENVDPIGKLTISNSTSVDFTQPFTVSGSLTLSAGMGTLYISDDVYLAQTTAVTVPTGATLEIRSGATLTAMGGLTVNGTLKIDSGAKLVIGSGKTLSVPSGGVLQLAGAAGAVATVDADSGSYTFTVGGQLNASYFVINRTAAAGLDISGQIVGMSNGEFHYPTANGYALTLQAASSATATNWNNLGFFNDASAAGVKNINATNYTGSAISLGSYFGPVGGGRTKPIRPTN